MFKKVLKIKLIVLISILINSNSLIADVIFSDNFDNQPYWSPQQLVDNSVTCFTGCSNKPIGYEGYWIDSSVYSSAGNNTLEISNKNYMGNSGKALTFWAESNGGGAKWASDGLLALKLKDEGYNELYVRFYIKFQKNWKWNTTDTSVQQKFFRISHYNGGSPLAMQASHRPMLIADLAKFDRTSDICYMASYRYETTYFAYQATPPHKEGLFYFGNGNYAGTGTDFWDTGMPGDGEWHCWEFYVKMNSKVGVADGIHRFWQDGVLIANHTDLAWSDVGSTESPRKLWNYVMIGGNNYNRYASASEAQEQWYSIDGLVISTERIGLECGSSPGKVTGIIIK